MGPNAGAKRGRGKRRWKPIRADTPARSVVWEGAGELEGMLLARGLNSEFVQEGMVLDIIRTLSKQLTTFLTQSLAQRKV